MESTILSSSMVAIAREYAAKGIGFSSGEPAAAMNPGPALRSSESEARGHRYYNPLTGRFLNRDPIREAGGLNLYAHTANDIINRWDMLGLSDADQYEDAKSHDHLPWLEEFVVRGGNPSLHHNTFSFYFPGESDGVGSGGGGASGGGGIGGGGSGSGGGGSSRDGTVNASTPSEKLPVLAEFRYTFRAQGKERQTSVLRELSPFNLDGSFARQSISVSDTLGGMLAWALGKVSRDTDLVENANKQMVGAYDDSAFGQTRKGPRWAYYTTRAAWRVSTIGVSTYSFARTPLSTELKVRILLEAALIYKEGNPGGPALDDVPGPLPPPQNPVPTQPVDD